MFEGMGTMYMAGAYKGQKRESDLPELVSQIITNHHVRSHFSSIVWLYLVHT